ncbi:skin secretory protein xP2-like [Setaria italica]|uniref:skin secretory protein xP2-like n=1 Tax=Setaria italica TaxID=4555 RepID=UPI000647373C|nr:skin secretory protein xP2-like [Setaria italica]
MTPGAPTEGTILAAGALAASEIRQRIWEALEDKDTDYPVPGHPPIRPDEGFVDLGMLTRVVDSHPPVLEDADRAASRGLVLQLAPKKALRVSSASVGRTAVPPAASGGVPGEVADPVAEAVPVTATGGVAAPSGAGEGVDPVPPSASPVDPSVQSIVPQSPQTEEVIDLDADEAEGTAVTGAGTSVPAAATGTAAATEEGVPASAAVAEEAVGTAAGTSAPGVPAEVPPAAEAEVPARGAPAGAEEPASVAAESEVAAGIFVPPPASEAVVPSSGSAAAPTAIGSHGVQSGEIRFPRLERGLWERFNLERERTRDLTMQVAAAQGAIKDLLRCEQAAQEDARRSEAKFQAVVDKACLDREEFQAAAEKARHDAEELGVRECAVGLRERVSVPVS